MPSWNGVRSDAASDEARRVRDGCEPAGGARTVLADRGRGLRIGLALATALTVHASGLALLTAWHPQEDRPPGEQIVAIDLAPEVAVAERSDAAQTAPPPAASASAAEPETSPAEEVAASEPAAQTDGVPTSSAMSPVQESPPLPAAATIPADLPEAPPSPAPPVVEAASVAAPVRRATPEMASPASTRPRHRALAVEETPARKPPTLKPPAAKPERGSPPAPARPGARQEASRAASSSAAVAGTRAASSRESMHGSAAAAVDPSALSRYGAQLAAALRARLRYPPSAGTGGTAILRFTVHRSGRVMASALGRSSGNPLLDQAALATASPGSLLPSAPEGLPRDTITVSIPLQFTLR